MALHRDTHNFEDMSRDEALAFDRKSREAKPDDTIADYVPLLDYVLVEFEDETEKTSAGGIILPDQSQKQKVEGRVVAAGPGNHQNGVWIANRVRVGMWVRFGQWAAGNERKINVNGKVYLLMREEDCILTRPSRFAKL